MKISVAVRGQGFVRARALADEIKRRALAELEARRARRAAQADAAEIAREIARRRGDER